MCRSDGSPFHMLQYLNLSLPKLGEGTIAGFMSQLPNNTIEGRPGSQFCEIVPRTNVFAGSALNSTNESAILPAEFSYTDFRTLRERLCGSPRRLPGKSMLNLDQWAGRHPIRIHRASKRCFGYGGMEPSLSFFRVHQYTGTLDEFLVPTIPTRTEAYFHARNENYAAEGRVGNLVGWLQSFIHRVGRRRAYHLTVNLQQQAVKNLTAAVLNAGSSTPSM